MNQPSIRPSCPHFSSGPCAKRPGWSIDCLEEATMGRSHRSKIGKAKLKEIIDRSREILGMPDDYLCGIVPASDTGAVEMALWSMLGQRGADLFAWESFGQGWVNDVQSQLELEDLRVFQADYGDLPDLNKADFSRDIVLTWNGTTSGVKVPDGEWIPEDRDGLVIADATSAVFAMDLPWEKLDVVTWSWQKVMGGEAAHGMIVLSPRAVERLENYSPPWPLPKIFRLTKKGKLNRGIFEGATINTPSMLACEDALDGLRWAEEIGGLSVLINRSTANLRAVESWEENCEWAGFLAREKSTRSNTSICLKINDAWYQELSPDHQKAKAKELAALLEDEGVAFDIGSYRDAPPGIRIWGGATVESSDTAALLPWLDWAFCEIQSRSS